MPKLNIKRYKRLKKEIDALINIYKIDKRYKSYEKGIFVVMKSSTLKVRPYNHKPDFFTAKIVGVVKKVNKNGTVDVLLRS